MTHNELIYRIKERMYGAGISDDADIDNRLISNWIATQRSYWIRNDQNKKRTIDQSIVQDLGCLEMESTDIAECCSSTSTNCYIRRTKLTLPRFIEFWNRTGITRVGVINKLEHTKLNFVSYNEAMRSGNSRWTQGQLYAFYRNDRIYIKSNNINPLGSTIKYINVQGVLENPIDAKKYTDCSGVSCYSDNSEYPIKSWMVDMIEDYIMSSKFNINLIVKDNSNDGTNEAINSKP